MQLPEIPYLCHSAGIGPEMELSLNPKYLRLVWLQLAGRVPDPSPTHNFHAIYESAKQR